jgi:branched-chain amino acid transport system ATP-binding protein
MNPDRSRRGVAVAVVEPELTIALKIAEQMMVRGHGKIVFRAALGELAERPDIPRQWLEVA